MLKGNYFKWMKHKDLISSVSHTNYLCVPAKVYFSVTLNSDFFSSGSLVQAQTLMDQKSEGPHLLLSSRHQSDTRPISIHFAADSFSNLGKLLESHLHLYDQPPKSQRCFLELKMQTWGPKQYKLVNLN